MAPSKRSAKQPKTAEATDPSIPPKKVTKKTSKPKKKATPHVAGQLHPNIDQGTQRGNGNGNVQLSPSASTNDTFNASNIDPRLTTETIDGMIIHTGSQFGLESALVSDYPEDLTTTDVSSAASGQTANPTDNSNIAQATNSAYDPTTYLANRALAALNQVNAQAAAHNQASLQAVPYQNVQAANIQAYAQPVHQAAPTAPMTMSGPILHRPVPNNPNAAQELTTGQPGYEYDSRTIEGALRSVILQRAMIETGKTSWYARYEGPGREAQIFNDIATSLASRIPNLNPPNLVARDIDNKPLRCWIYDLFVTFLKAQYGNSFAAQRASFQAECELEARIWVKEKLRELDNINRRWIRDNTHLQQDSQSHMELPSRH